MEHLINGVVNFFFSKLDFNTPNNLIKGLIEITEKYKKKILNNFVLVEFKEDVSITNSLLIKNGYWLNYFNGNLFKFFKILKKRNLFIFENAKVTKLIVGDNNKINGIQFITDGML